jgi:hypothetical protein
MQNSPGIAIAALVAALALGLITVLSVMAGIGGDRALSELQTGASAWALALALFGVQGIVSLVVEGRQLVLGAIEPHMGVRSSLMIATLSIVVFLLAGATGLAIISGRPTAVIGSAAGTACLVLGLLLLFYKEAFVGHEAHLESRNDGIPW